MKAVVFTLGCKVNECESASIIRGLEEKGYEVSDELEEADLYIVNTCAVTAEAEKKSRQMIARVSKKADNAKILICGCASQNHPESFSGKPNVTVVTGADKKSKILELLDEEGNFVEEAGCVYDEMLPPLRLKTRAFVKVQDGCNHFCSYCIIPYLRGRTRSRSVESVVKEVENNGARETVIVGIDLSSFEDNGRTLGDLMTALKDVPQRIRLGSLEVGVITEKFLTALKEMKNFCPHFHLSLQSGANATLKRMNRHYTREEYIEKCRMIYRIFPDAAITTDIIVGFCEETEEDFCDSLDIVKEVGFAHVHCFPYSVRTGTVAAKKYKDIPAEFKKERLARLQAVAEETELKFRKKFIGTEADVVTEEFADGFTQGYTANYLRVFLDGEHTEPVLHVKITGVCKDGVLAEII